MDKLTLSENEKLKNQIEDLKIEIEDLNDTLSDKNYIIASFEYDISDLEEKDSIISDLEAALKYLFMYYEETLKEEKLSLRQRFNVDIDSII